jgi:hypothetical protein
MTLTRESFVNPLAKRTPHWLALRQKEVRKGYEVSSARRTHDSVECTQGVLHLRQRLMRVLLKTRYARIYCHRAL